MVTTHAVYTTGSVLTPAGDLSISMSHIFMSHHLILINNRWKKIHKKTTSAPAILLFWISQMFFNSWKLCGALTFTSAAILSIANPSTVSCKEKWTYRHWSSSLRTWISFFLIHQTELMWRHVLMCFCVWGRSSSSFGFYLDEPWYEEAALVAVVKLLPVVLDKLPGGFPAVFTASCHAADYWHGVLRTNLFLSGRRTREVSWGEDGSESLRLERNLSCHWTKKLKLDLNF